jgi:hypothetical protein
MSAVVEHGFLWTQSIRSILPEIRSLCFPIHSHRDFDRQAFDRTGLLRRSNLLFRGAILRSISCSLANHPPYIRFCDGARFRCDLEYRRIWLAVRASPGRTVPFIPREVIPFEAR